MKLGEGCGGEYVLKTLYTCVRFPKDKKAMSHLFTISKSKTIKYLLGVCAHAFMCACAVKNTINT